MKLWGTFLRNLVKGAAGNLAAALLQAATSHTPTGDAVDMYVWRTVLVGGLTGLAGVLMRWAAGSRARG